MLLRIREKKTLKAMLPNGCRFTNNLISWTLVSFALAVEVWNTSLADGSDDNRLALTELIALRQIGTVEDYATLPALFEGSSKKKKIMPQLLRPCCFK